MSPAAQLPEDDAALRRELADALREALTWVETYKRVVGGGEIVEGTITRSRLVLRRTVEAALGDRF
jgi:hypothetical protein